MARAMRVEDEEMSLSEEELLVYQDAESARHSRIRLAALVLGAAALVACVGLGARTALGQDSATSKVHTKLTPQVPGGRISARALLESDDLAEAVTDNVMKQGSKHIDSWEREHVKALVTHKFSNVSRQFRTNDPEGSRALDEVTLDGEQQQAALRVLRSLSDPRVQRLSMLVAHAVRDSGSEDPSEIERHVDESLKHHQEEIRQLRDSIRPEPLHAMGGNEGHLRLDHDHVRLLKSFGDSWDMQMSITKPTVSGARRLATTTATPLYSADRAFAILRMIFDQCRVVIDIVRPAARLFGHDVHANPWITSAFGMADSIFAGVSCELDGAAHDMDTMEMASCPLRVASAASDALRWLLEKYHMIHYPAQGAEPSDTSGSSSEDGGFFNFGDDD